jgi:hypothetical protein
MPAMFERYLEFGGSSKLWFINSTFSRGTPEDIARAPDWETLLTRGGTAVEAIGYSVRTVV